jgi:hypothetical protein
LLLGNLLRAGYAGATQILANIDANGFGSYGFDADPAVLQFDPYTADYGIAFYGYARSAGTYVTHDPEFGWPNGMCAYGIENSSFFLHLSFMFRAYPMRRTEQANGLSV